MTDFAKYDGTGKVIAWGQMPADMLSLQAGNIYLGVIDGATQYIVEGVATARPANPATQTGTALANLPTPCVISINGTPYPCTDATANLTIAQPGIYAVTVAAFPHLDANFTVTV